MAKRTNYASYDVRIKAAISITGRSDLFPDLKIPRATAEYWLKQPFVLEDPILESVVIALNHSRHENEYLKKEKLAAYAQTKLLKDVLGIMGFRLRWKHIGSTEKRDKILNAIAMAMVDARRNSCLETLDLSLSRFKRWKREQRGCGLPEMKVCPKASLNQLTFEEIQLMGQFVTSTEYAHFPIRSLHYFAKREGKLFCTYSTWRKYIDQYGWLRPRKKRMKKIERIGIRAKHPNEIWHLDLSYFILPDGKKCFIQAVIDNYSRFVLAWQVLTSYDGAKTASLLEKAIQRSIGSKSNCGLSLIVDGGGENKGFAVKKLEALGHFKKQVARFEIAFSNSMVEALFRSLKHNYLYSKEIRSHKSLKKHVDFWCTDHNARIPHTAFKGETPLEKFNQSWNTNEEIRILVRHQEALKLRLKHNQKVFCEICEVA